MADIRHRFGTGAAPRVVYEAVATVDGLRGWWTEGARGDPSPGGRLAFHFGGDEPSAVMEVLESIPDSLVRWRCAEGPDAWVDTTFTFAISNSDGETVLTFTNDGWREAVPFLHHCSTKWAYFLLGLRSVLEGGPGLAFPHDAAISAWG